MQQEERKVEDVSIEELTYLRFELEDQIKKAQQSLSTVVNELARRAAKFKESVVSNGAITKKTE